MEFFTEAQFRSLSNPGVASVQLLSPHNSTSSRLTITRVTVQPGAGQARHSHPASEQIWVAISGSGTLLLADGATRRFSAGRWRDLQTAMCTASRTPAPNPSSHMSMTTPPIDFAYAYREAR